MQPLQPDSATVSAHPHLYRVTPGQATAYAACPLYYRAAYSVRRPAVSRSAQRGTMLHDLVHRFNRLLITTGVIAEVDTLVTQDWPPLAGTPDPELADLAQRVLSGYVDFLRVHRLTVRSAETWIKTPPRPLRGRPDLAIEFSGMPDVIAVRPDGTIMVVDLKTGSALPTALDLAEAPGSFVYEQLAVYAYGPTDVTIAQILPHTHDEVCVQLSDAQREASRASVRAMVMALDSDTFLPQPSSHCALCPIEAQCPARRPRADWTAEEF